VEFTIVILDEHIPSYSQLKWTDWKDDNRKQMISQGDNWSKTTLIGNDIWECLESNQIDPLHLVQWKPASEKLHRVSLPTHPHPFDQSK
jgi:hypothetical protein|tara:strand:+ start:504 stop:770 length:267 start_codon:yes stop_codon:yes gene_type:complete